MVATHKLFHVNAMQQITLHAHEKIAPSSSTVTEKMCEIFIKTIAEGAK